MKYWTIGAPALGAGLLMAASVPPWGFWPLGIIGAALLAWRLGGLPARARAACGLVAGIGLFGPTLWWIGEIHLVGWVLLIPFEALFFALAAVLAGKRSPLMLAPALVIGEALRWRIPFGGLPMGGIDLGQAAGPLAPSVGVAGPLALVAVTALAGAVLAGAVRAAIERHVARSLPKTLATSAALCLVVALPLLGRFGPSTHEAGQPIRMAAVQGGGRHGLHTVDTDAADVYQAHIAASAEIRQPIDLVLWPEDVVDVPGPILEQPERDELAAIAGELRATLMVGVVEDAGDNGFRNAMVAFAPDGRPVSRYDKVQRVPFGEWIPLRSVVGRVADVSLIPRDAVPGRGAGVMVTPAGRFGVLISFEVFYPGRGRAGVTDDTDAVLNPTNAASFVSTQVPAQEVAAARLRAWETGRWVVQAAPTGFSSIVRADGRVEARTSLGDRAVLQASIPRRHGRTPYDRVGDWPALLVALGMVVTRGRRVAPIGSREASA